MIVPIARGAGAGFGEGEVALSMTDSILRNLGATPDQLDAERGRIRDELVAAPRV